MPKSKYGKSKGKMKKTFKKPKKKNGGKKKISTRTWIGKPKY